MASPAIKVDMKIGSDDQFDSYENWNLIYLESDTIFSPPMKKRETTTYAEQEGENVDPRTVYDVFDYKVKFLIECPNSNMENANEKIRLINEQMRGKKASDSDAFTFNRVTLWNYYKRVKIEGIPEPIREATEFFRDSKGNVWDCVVVELTIHVDKPSLCDFDIDSPYTK